MVTVDRGLHFDAVSWPLRLSILSLYLLRVTVPEYVVSVTLPCVCVVADDICVVTFNFFNEFFPVIFVFVSRSDLAHLGTSMSGSHVLGLSYMW